MGHIIKTGGWQGDPTNDPSYFSSSKIEIDITFSKKIRIFFGSELSETKKLTKKIEKKNREKLFLARNCLHRIMSQLKKWHQKNWQKIKKNNSKIICSSKKDKNREKLFLAQNCLQRIMSQLQDDTKKIKKKNSKIIFGSELSEANNEPTFGKQQKNDKNWEREKSRTIIFGSELSEANNEPTFRIHQKNWQKIEKKIEKNYLWLKIVCTE